MTKPTPSLSRMERSSWVDRCRISGRPGTGGRIIRWVAAGVAMVWVYGLASLAVAQTPPRDEPSEVAAPAENVVVDRQADDSEIDARLTRILIASGWFERLNVDVREGIVFLDGVARTEGHQEWAAKVAGKTEEVVAVINRIDVRPTVSWDFTPAWDEVRRLALKTQQALPLFLLGMFILGVTWQLARLMSWFARWIFRDRIASPLMLMVTARAFAIPVFVLGLYLVLQISGLTRLAITVLGGTGLIGIVLGFAFRDIAENFLASLLLSIRNPFRSGDLIRLGEHEGIVRNLNTRSTVLLTAEGNHVQIPNATVFKSVITNFSSNPSRRAEFIIGIGYDDPTSEAQTIIEHIVAEHPAVRDDPVPFVIVDQLAASTVNLKVLFWFDSASYSPAKLRSALMRQTKAALLEAGISMPDEAREVIFPNGLPIYRMRSDTSVDQVEQSVHQPPAADEADVTEAEGGLDREDDDAIREASASRTPDEKENLLDDRSAREITSP